MKTVLREIITMALIASVMLLILVLVFYDYLINDNTIPTESKYNRTNEVKQALEDKKDYDTKAEENVIGTLTKAAYSIDNSDISEYIAEGVLTQGKVNPFAEMTTEENNGENNTNNNGNSNTSNGSSQNNNTTSQNTTSTNTNSDSTGTFFEKAGSK